MASRGYKNRKDADELEDIEVTKARYSREWKAEQIQLREQLIREDVLDFEVPQALVTRTVSYNDDGTHQYRINRKDAKLDVYSAENPLLIGGMDISCSADKMTAVAGLVVCAYPTMELVYMKTIRCRLDKPYIAGFLAFREVDHLVEVLDQAKAERPDLMPQVVLVDGNGVLHYRRFGLASHLGVLAGIPTIGVAKKLLNVGGLSEEYFVAEANRVTQKVRDCVGLIAGDQGDVVGAAMKTVFRPKRGSSGYIYISIGHRVTLDTAVKICASCLTQDKREPFPVYEADRITREKIRAWDRERGTIAGEYGRRGHIRVPQQAKPSFSDDQRGRGRGRGRGGFRGGRGGRGRGRGRGGGYRGRGGNRGRGRGRGRGNRRDSRERSNRY